MLGNTFCSLKHQAMCTCNCQWANGHSKIRKAVSIDTWVRYANHHDYPWNTWSGLKTNRSSAMCLHGAMAGQPPQGRWNKSLGCQSEERFSVSAGRVCHLIGVMIKIGQRKEGKTDRSLSGDKTSGIQERSDRARVYYCASQEAAPLP